MSSQADRAAALPDDVCADLTQRGYSRRALGRVLGLLEIGRAHV